MNMVNKAIGLTLLIGLAAVSVVAQTSSNSQSLGDYARQVRKSPDAASKPKVFDNDNLPRNDKLSVVGNVSPAPDSISGENPGEAKSGEPAKPAETPAETKEGEAKPPTAEAKKAAGDENASQEAVKQWTDKIDDQKQQIDLQSRELDVMQREYQLRAAAIYADAGNRLRNQADWDKQDNDYKQKIADKQKSIEEAKQKLEDLQEEARKAGMPASVQQQ